MENTPKSTTPIRIAGGIWTGVGLGLFALGGILWFHLPYLLFLDEWHALWGTVALTIGLFAGQILFDRLVDWIRSGESVLQRFGWVASAILSTAIAIEAGMRFLGWGTATVGLANLAFGIAFLWSCRRFWGRPSIPNEL